MKTQKLLLFPLMLITFFGYSQQSKSTESYLQQIKALRTTHCKLGMGLDDIGKKDIDQSKLSSNWIMKEDMVLVNAISSTDVTALEKDIKALGANEIKVHGNIVTAWVPIDEITKLNECAVLNQALPEIKPNLNVGLTTSQAATTLFTEEASNIFDVDGTGVRIGILSDSFNARGDATTTVASGDIPGIGNPNGFTTPVVVLSEIADLAGGSDEGRGMAELIHDVAPGAELYFYSAFNGFFDFADGIRALADAGCDVIVDDIGYFLAGYFQDGAVARAVDDVVAQGVVYLSSAGNSSRESYEDDYKEVDLDGANLYDFGGGDFTQSISIAPGENINLWFQWDDPTVFVDATATDLPFPDTDIDVTLFDASSQELLTSSIFDNIADGFPIEIIDFTNETSEPIVAEIIVTRFAGPAPRRIKYINFAGPVTFVEDFPGNFAGTCFGHSNAAGAIAVGAQAYVFNNEFSDLGFGGSTSTSLNAFSSYGGIPILIDNDGNDIEPVDRQKPDVVGTDFTNTTSFPEPVEGFFDLEGDGFPNFGGTSAAAPHVAAVVALMLQERPDLTPQEVWTVLDETALDMDDATTEGFDVGYDIATGMGFVQGDKALAALQGTPTVYRYEAYDATTDTFLTTLTDDSSVPLEAVEGGLINIVALATDGLEEAESVRLVLSGSEARTEQDSSAPFSLFGDDGQGDFRNWEVGTGAYTISSTAFDQMNGQGTSGNTYSIGFGVDYSALISSFILVNADTNEDIMPLEETMDISIFEENPNVTIRAEVGSEVSGTAFAEKVIFNLTGALQRFTEDTTAPYALFGDNNGDYNPWQPSPIVGVYDLEATPSARRNGTGTDGITTSFSFEIIDNSFPSFANNFNESIISLNSSTGILSVSATTEENITFSVFNAQGTSIFNGSTSNQSTVKVDLSSYTKGLFIVKSQDGETINTKVYMN